MRTIILGLLCLFCFSCAEEGERVLTEHPGGDRNPSWSPDGRQIAFDSDRNGNWDIFIMNADGTDLVQVTSDPGPDRAPSWHPNGEQLLFESTRAGKKQLYLTNTDGSGLRPITLEKDHLQPAWARMSPDGEQILFSAPDSMNVLQLFVCDDNGQDLLQLTDYKYRSLWGNWSPSGHRIVFHSRKDTENKDDEIYTMLPNGTQQKRLTQHSTHNFCPDWSPDGRFIVHAVSVPAGRSELYLWDTEGEVLQQLTFNEDGDTEPDYGPYGNYIAFSCFRNGSYEICVMPVEVER